MFCFFREEGREREVCASNFFSIALLARFDRSVCISFDEYFSQVLISNTSNGFGLKTFN